MFYQVKASGKIVTKGPLKTYPAPKRPAAGNITVKYNGKTENLPCKLTAGKGRGKETAYYGYITLNNASYYFSVPAGFELAKAQIEITENNPAEKPAE